VSASWVAGSVRAKALARRRLGTAATHGLATAGSLSTAVELLHRSPYGARVPLEASLAQAQRGVAETLLWHLRVLAGWLPSSGAQMLRAFAGGFEIANIDEHLQAMRGRAAEPPFRLGSLATSWPSLAMAGTPEQMRTALAQSPWGEPGGGTDRELALMPRLRWGERLAAVVPAAEPWVCGAVALLVARDLVAGRTLPPMAQSVAARMIGQVFPALSLSDIIGRVRPQAAWALENVRVAEDLWRAEAAWWRRIRQDGTRLLNSAGFGPDRVVGVVAVLAADAALVRGALELAARPGAGPEALDALA
jgi:hypothetical protein